MSGGSYDYLCYTDVEDMMNKLDQLQQMADRLAGLGYADDAAMETQELLLTIRQYRNRVNATMKRLTDLWRAVEWWDSRDTGEDEVKDALNWYRTKGETP